MCKHQVRNHVYGERKSSLQTFTKWVMYEQIVLVDTWNDWFVGCWYEESGSG